MSPLSRRLLGATVATLLTVGIPDTAGRLTRPDPRAHLPHPTSMIYSPSVPILREEEPGHWTFAWDSSFFRERHWETPAPEGTYRVIVAGDSTVYGLFPAALEKVLHVPDREVEV